MAIKNLPIQEVINVLQSHIADIGSRLFELQGDVAELKKEVKKLNEK